MDTDDLFPYLRRNERRGLRLGRGAIGRKTGGSIFIITGGGGGPQGADPAQSTIGVSAGTVVSGSLITVTLTAKTAAGVQQTTGGLTVVPSKSGGTATGNLSGVTDHNDGTYTWTYTGVLAGTAQTLGATINGSSVSSSLPTCAVTPGAIDRTVSTLTLAAAGATAGGAAVLATVHAKDAAGNNLTTGGATVVIAHTGGTSGVTISAVTDVGNGTYTATVTPNTTGTATTMSGTIGGSAITTTMPTFTVNNTLRFASAWESATGLPSNQDAALNDGGKFTALTGQPNLVLRVIAAAGSGLSNTPTTNVLEVNHQVSANPPAGQPGLDGLWASPQVGESRHWRTYLYNNMANDEGDRNDSHHPVETLKGGGDCGWQFNFTTNSDGTFNFFIWTNSSHASGAAGKWYACALVSHLIQNLPKFKWLRIEVKATKVGTNSYNMAIRVYDDTGTLLYGEASASPTLGTFRNPGPNNAGGPNVEIDAAPITMMDTELNGFEIGTSGGSGLANMLRIEKTYYTGIAVRDDDWCGPYVPGVG